ncbi:hypothetical protein BC332_25215 [Capsicum chinense]|nr:hypothetical protein BC332_25215 [Capsicum chinense]
MELALVLLCLQVLYACLTLNPPHTPEHTLLKWTTGHPVPSVAASKALSELNQIQRRKKYGFVEHIKVETQGDLVLVDAFIHGNFSSVDKNNGLLNVFMIFVNNRDLKASVIRSTAVSSTKYFIRHVSNQNTLTQVRKNISRHYDLSEEKDLKVAQEWKPSDEASRPISPMDARRSRDDNNLNDIL